MTRTHNALALGGLLLAGLWGCSQSSADSQQKETRLTRLEEELKGAIATREALKGKVTALEEQVRAETERTKLIELERDALNAQLRTKVAEKDSVVMQYDDLVKNLETTLGQAKVAQSKHKDGADSKVPGTVTSQKK